jgi:hypothetical protein
MRGAPNFAAACVFAALHSGRDKIGTPTPRFAAAARSLTPTPTDRQAAPVLGEQTEVHMHTHTARTQAWLAELASIQAEIAAHGMLAPAPRLAAKRPRKLRPLWEE